MTTLLIQRRVVCDLCGGGGKGAGCDEQGGQIHGLCARCHGYGGWHEDAPVVTEHPGGKDGFLAALCVCGHQRSDHIWGSADGNAVHRCHKNSGVGTPIDCSCASFVETAR